MIKLNSDKFPTFNGHFNHLFNMLYQLAWEGSEISGRIQLPASKSISNRLLILEALASRPGTLRGISESKDTCVMQHALSSGEREVNIGHAGTAMRFLTAFLSIGRGERILTGSDRMQNRPIGKLVEALNELGADISYAGKSGYPPLKIRGKAIRGGDIHVDSSISSQFISALMMIGPSLQEGLTIHLENETVSLSYLHLTMNLMRDYGIDVLLSGKTIHIPGIEYAGMDQEVESDWSAASYWYAMASLSGNVNLHLTGLKQGSYQGDSVLPELFTSFGIGTRFREDGILLHKIDQRGHELDFDFRDNPDLVQTMAVLCGLMEKPFYFRGTKTLQIKETDRIHALDQELRKLGIAITCDPGGEWIRWDGKRSGEPLPDPRIETYQDHRMAMAFAPASMRVSGLTIEDPEVTVKSYPGFWEDLEQVGFRIRKT